jgi:hypothetical protein
MNSRPRQRIVRIIARLNVRGPAKHAIWLTADTASAGFDSHLACGVVPPGEDAFSIENHSQIRRP